MRCCCAGPMCRVVSVRTLPLLNDAVPSLSALGGLSCRFSNECDTVLFHGWGNGTGIIGNCYVCEINPFSVLA